MSAQLALRIAFALIFIHGVLHTFGHANWKKATDPILGGVIKKMTGPKFPFMGVKRSMGQYFDGYGYGMSVALFLISALLWICAGAIPNDVVLVKKIVIAVAISLLIWGIDELFCFFPFAACLSLLACAATFYSFILLSQL